MPTDLYDDWCLLAQRFAYLIGPIASRHCGAVKTRASFIKDR